MLKTIAAPLAVAVVALGHVPVAAATIDGLWRSPPGKSGAWITVQVGPCSGAPERRCGTVTGAYDGANPKVVGEQVLEGLERQEDGSWAKGRIIQPIKGRVYRSNIRLAGEDVLRVQGCALLGLICKHQTWTRVQ